VAAFVLHLAALAITSRVNVPLNDALAAAGAPDRIASLRCRRRLDMRLPSFRECREPFL
jgi:uncharacterized membrane protein